MFSFRKINGSFFTAILVFCIYSAASAQVYDFPPVREYGSFKSIENDSIFDIIFSYDQMRVSRFETEELYVSHMVTLKNEKEAGSGDIWFREWNNAKKDYFEPGFISSINNVLERKNKKFSPGSDSKHILLVKTIYLEPGNHMTGERRDAPIGHFEFYFVEKSNPENIVLKLYMQDVSGFQISAIDPDIGSRISSNYRKAGKLLGKYIYPYL